MQLEAYFDFLTEDDIRLKGTRIGIETILYEYIHRCQTPEEIAEAYTGLTLEQVYATILYYWHRHEAVSKYLKRWLEYCLQAEQTQDQNPTPFVQRLIRLKAERQSPVSA
ncbi:MAG: DUF433 domain-containing protein [Cyanobacteria bacterium P01_D01_bin.44]